MYIRLLFLSQCTYIDYFPLHFVTRTIPCAATNRRQGIANCHALNAMYIVSAAKQYAENMHQCCELFISLFLITGY